MSKDKKRKVKVYSAFAEPVVDGFDFYDDESPVQQHLRDESDINYIVNFWSRQGVPLAQIPSGRRPAHHPDAPFVDSTVLQSYEQALNTLLSAEQILDSFTPEQRRRFNDDPIEFMQSCLDESRPLHVSGDSTIEAESEANLSNEEPAK